MSDVKLLAQWSGWCDPCESERPLVLTETGQRGLRAWMRGVGHEDRALTLTCRVCGEWQPVDHDEEDVLEDAPVRSPLAALQPLGIRQVVVRPAAFAPYPVASSRRVVQIPVPATSPDATLELIADGYDLISAAS